MSFYNNQPDGSGTPADPQKPDAVALPSTTNQTYVGDTVQGIGYGLQEGIQSMANLGQGLWGKQDFDLISPPDLLPGQMASGLSQFATGFLPGLGVAGKLNKLGKGSGFTAKLARGAESVASPKALNALRKPGKLDKLGIGSLQFAGAAMAQDALVTGLAFEAGAGTMADVLNEFGMAPAFLDFLGTEESDNEAEGRFKQSLEAGLTVPAFTVLGGLLMMGSARVFRNYFNKVNTLELGPNAASMDPASPQFVAGKEGAVAREAEMATLKEANAKALREAAGEAQLELEAVVVDAVAQNTNPTDLVAALRPLMAGDDQSKLDALQEALSGSLSRYKDARKTAIRETTDPLSLKDTIKRDSQLMVDEVTESLFGDQGLIDMPLLGGRDSALAAGKSIEIRKLEMVLGSESLPKLKRTNLEARLKQLQAEKKVIVSKGEGNKMSTLAHIGSVGEYAIGRTIVDTVPQLDAAVKAGDIGGIRAGLKNLNESLAARETFSALRSTDQMDHMRLKVSDDLAEQARNDYRASLIEMGGGANMEKFVKQWEAKNMRPLSDRLATADALDETVGSAFSGDGLRNRGIDLDDMLDGVEDMTPEMLKDIEGYMFTMRSVAGKADPVEAMRELAKWQTSGFFSKLGHLAAEAKMNGVLSIGGTISQAIVGNAMTFGLRPLQSVITRVPGISKLFKGDLKESIQRGINLSTAGHVETMQNMGESVDLLRHAFNEGGGPKAFLQAASRRDVSSKVELATLGGLGDGRSSIVKWLSRMMDKSTGSTKVGAVSASASGALQAPMKGLERVDNLFRVSTGFYGLRSRVQKQLMENGLDMDAAFAKADSQAKATLKSQMGVLYEGDQMGKALRRRQGLGEVDPRISREASSPYAGMNLSEVDQLKGHIGAEAGRVERNLFTSGLLDSQGKQLPDSTIVQRMGGWVTRATGGNPVMRLMVPFVKVSTNAINTLAFNPTVGGASAVANLIATKRLFKLGDVETMASLRKSNNSMLRRLSSSDPEVVASAATHMAISIPITVATIGAGIGKAMIGDDDDRPMVTGKPPTDPMVANTWRSLGITPYSVWNGTEYVAYNRVEGLGPSLGVMVDVSNTLEELITNFQDDAAAGEIATDLVTGIYTTMSENLSKGVGMESLETLTRIIAGSASPERIATQLEKEITSLVPLGGSINDAAGLGKGLFGDGEIAEIDGLLDRIKARYGFDTDGTSRDLLGRTVKREGETAVGSYALRLRGTTTSDSTIAREMATHMSVYRKMSSTYKSMLDLTDPEYVRNGQSAWDRAQELSGTVKIGGKDMRSALRKEIASSSYSKLDNLGSDFGPSPRAERLRGIMQRYRQKALTQLSREIPELRRDARKAERNETRCVASCNATARRPSRNSRVRSLNSAVTPARLSATKPAAPVALPSSPDLCLLRTIRHRRLRPSSPSRST
jgi:hypothetical protein